MWREVATALLALCAACGARFPAAPSQGGPAWTELTSEHFTVWTDGEPSTVYGLIGKMERFHHVAAAVAYPTAPSSGRALAIVLRSDGELGAVNNNGEPRAFTLAAIAPLWQPVVVLSLSSSEQRTVAHELTHLVSFAVIHHQPRWLAEAMAVYFESMQLDAGQTTVMLGAAPKLYGRNVDLVSIRALFNWGRVSSSAAEYALYHTGWALFAFLINEHRSELAHYLWLVDRTGEPVNGTRQQQQQRTWEQGFPSLPFDEVDDKLQHWLLYGKHMELKFYVNPKDSPVAVRTLSDADAHAIRALILGGPTPDQASRARVELSEAIAREPTNVLAWALKVLAGEKLTVDAGRSLTAAHPDDWRAWWLATAALVDADGEPTELDRTRSQACALLAQNRALVAPPGLCPIAGTSQSSR